MNTSLGHTFFCSFVLTSAAGEILFFSPFPAGRLGTAAAAGVAAAAAVAVVVVVVITSAV